MPSMLHDEALNDCQNVVEDPDKGGVIYNTHTQGKAIYEVGYGTRRYKVTKRKEVRLHFILYSSYLLAYPRQAEGRGEGVYVGLGGMCGA